MAAPCPLSNCCGGSCSLCVQANDLCSNSAVAGTFTVTQGGTTIGTCTTLTTGATPGKCCITVPSSGTYSWSFAASGYTTQTGTVSVTCPTGATVVPALSHLPGVPVSVRPQLCGSGSITTEVAGDITYSIPTYGASTTAYGSVAGDLMTLTVPANGTPISTWTYTLVSASGRFQTYTNTVNGGPCAGYVPPPGNFSVLTPAGGFACSGSCAYPWKTTLHVTDAVYGATTVTYNGSAWTGTLTVPQGTAGCIPPAFTSLVINYSWQSGSLSVTAHYTFTGGTSPANPGSITYVSTSCPFSGAGTESWTLNWGCGAGQTALTFSE